MKCCRCPLYHYWSNESDRGESCAIFGDGWDSPFQYEDKEGTTIGCYLDRHFIEKADAERDEYYASMAESAVRYFEDEPQTDYGDFADRLAYERGVKHAWEVAQKVFDSTVTFYEAEDVAKQIDKMAIGKRSDATADKYNLYGKTTTDEPQQTDCPWK